MDGHRDGGDPLLFRRRVGVIMFFIGGVLCVNGAVFTQETARGRTGQGLVAGAFLGLAALMGLTKPRRITFHATLLMSIALMSCLVATASPLGTTPFFYLWPLVYAAYFDGVRMRVTAVAWMTLTLGIGLAVNPGLNHRADLLSGSVISVGLVAWLVGKMRERDLAQQRLLATAALTDPLTGLLNRRGFEPALLGAIETCSVESPTSVVIFDLDHFKRLNDEWGHLAGDTALTRVAQALQRESRSGDAIARFGGDEFVVTLRDSDPRACTDYAERVRARIGELAEPGLPPLRLSYGTATTDSPDTDSASILGRADTSLYVAKGRRERGAVERTLRTDLDRR